MRVRERATALFQSLVLPVLAMSLLVFFTMATVMLSASDRAIVWAEGTPAQLDSMHERVMANPWFGHGNSALATADTPLPAKCGPEAREFSFAALGEFEAQAAQDILMRIASDAGAAVCQSNVFVINELPKPRHQTWSQAAAASVLNASLLPCALVILVFVGLSSRLGLANLSPAGVSNRHTLALSVVAAIAASLMLLWAASLTGSAGAEAKDSLSLANVGYSLAFALVVAVPVIEEFAFRGWMLPLAERGLGSAIAAGLSSLLYAAASFPQTAWDAAAYFAVGLIYAGLYLRTRSLAACIVANILASGFHFWVV